MKLPYLITLCCLVLACFSSCRGQVKKDSSSSQKVQSTADVGGPFENREFTYYNIPRNISATDTSPGFTQSGQKLLVTGIIYQSDGKTPAPDVLLYYYQTNSEGRYVHKPEEKRSMPPNDRGQTHGYIRGWVKTGNDGRYSIYTIRPGSYPDATEPAHIHVTIKEPNDIAEYWIDDFVFDDDKLLTQRHRDRLSKRAGSGILELKIKDDLLVGERNLVLGLNIPGYPSK